MDVRCPTCGERESLRGTRSEDRIDLVCDGCGHTWRRSLSPRCPTCGGEDIQTVPLAILERGRGTQLSVVGTRPIDLCSTCDAPALGRYHRNLPNPLMPDELPTIGTLDQESWSSGC
ncbi:MAG: hypothetical protein ACE5GC_00860 [Acidimicrobiia bacterium]